MNYLNLTYRLANFQDATVYYKWANDDEVRKNSFSPNAIPLGDHKIWFSEKLNSKKSCLMIFFLGFDAVGQVRIDLLDRKYATIDYSVDAEHRGKKIGSNMLSIARVLINKFRPYIILKGIVRIDNYASIKAFDAAKYIHRNEIITHSIRCYEYYSK